MAKGKGADGRRQKAKGKRQKSAAPYNKAIDLFFYYNLMESNFSKIIL